jgi:hypothetical protein
MSTLAEQVVEQLKTDMDNVYDAGYQKGVLASGSATLGIKTGTVEVSGGYTMKINHGCGKLPLFVVVGASLDTPPVLNKLTFAFWQNDYISFGVRGSTTGLFHSMQMQTVGNVLPDNITNAVMVDEEKIVINSTHNFIGSTFTWYAIYEV